MEFPRKRAYPSEFTLNNNTWYVKFKRSLKDHDGEDIPHDTLGLCDFNERTIYIKLGMCSEATFDTFVHEALHAAEFEFGIQLSGKPHVEGDRLYKLTSAIVDFFKNL